VDLVSYFAPFIGIPSQIADRSLFVEWRGTPLVRSVWPVFYWQMINPLYYICVLIVIHTTVSCWVAVVKISLIVYLPEAMVDLRNAVILNAGVHARNHLTKQTYLSVECFFFLIHLDRALAAFVKVRLHWQFLLNWPLVIFRKL
jgi:hypothetical protein